MSFDVDEVPDFEGAAEAELMLVAPTDDGGMFLGLGNGTPEGEVYVVLDKPSVIALMQSMLAVLQGEQELHAFKIADDVVRGGHLGGATA